MKVERGFSPAGVGFAKALPQRAEVNWFLCRRFERVLELRKPRLHLVDEDFDAVVVGERTEPGEIVRLACAARAGVRLIKLGNLPAERKRRAHVTIGCLR